MQDYEVSNYVREIDKITNVEDLEAVVDAYKFFKSNNVVLDYLYMKDITKENINDCKAIFTFLKENASYIDDTTIAGTAASARPNSTECVKQIFDVLGNHPEVKNSFFNHMIYENLTPESTAAKLEFYKQIQDDPEVNKNDKLIFLIVNTDETNLDIAKILYEKYKNNEIKDPDNISDILNKPIEFVKENLDFLIKYQDNLNLIGQGNINLVKAAVDRNLSTEDLNALVTAQRQNPSMTDGIIKLLKEGKSLKHINFYINFEKYKKNIAEKIDGPLSYEPSLAYSIDSKRNKSGTTDAVGKVFPLEGLVTKKEPPKTLDLPSTNEMIKYLDGGIRFLGKRKIKIEIPDEGGMKPVQGDNTIHPEDVSRLGKTEDAGFELCYGVKRNWSNSKIARDLMQNFFNGHGGTLEGVSLDVKKEGGKYKVRISGKGTYDYGYLDALGASSSDINPTSIGRQYGEGAKIAALSLLTKQGTDYVKFACGEWDMTFNRSSDDIDSAHMTQVLSKNEPELEGNFVEFTTDDPELVKQIIDAKDYFGHPYNKDFQNFDYENKYFGIKILPEGEKGNIYVVQRYETANGLENSLDRFSIVFKEKPDSPELIAKSGDEFVLNADRDRGMLSSSDIASLVKKYASTMNTDELAKLISSLEPLWSKPGNELTGYEKNIIGAFAEAAKSKNIQIDFLSKKYIFMNRRSSAEDIEMARLMGYKPVSNEDLLSIGLKTWVELNTKEKVAVTPNEVETKKIKILNEGVRVIQELLPEGEETLIRSYEVDAPKFVFNEGGSPNEAAEAITGYKTYKGHWVKGSALYLQKFEDLLATWFHEMSHKNGGDVSTEFTDALKDIEMNILKILSDNPEALSKMRYLAKLYEEADPKMKELHKLSNDKGDSKSSAAKFDSSAYKTDVERKLAEPDKYVEYSELRYYTPPVGQSDNMLKYEPLPQKTGKNNAGTLPSTSDLMSTLNTKGSVEVAIPDAGGLNPTNSENPVIHPEDRSKLGVTEKVKIKVRYAEATNWSNFKIARDLMQNFYDGNGHTLEGVTIKVDKTPDGYKVRVEGLGNYDYKHLQRIGSSTKPNLVEDLGNFGEGTRIIATSLIAKGSDSVKYGCGEWQLEFGRENGRLAGDDVVQTLTQNSRPVNGNYLEFTTKDASMVEELINAKDYFYHPYNENFQNLDFENKFFGFKRLDSSEESTIYLGQKYEFNKDFKDSPQKLCIIFKKLPNYPELKALSRYEFKLSTGCDRIGLDHTDVEELASRYAKSMTDEELIQSLASLEDIWTTTNPRDDIMIDRSQKGSLEYTFVKGLLSEASRRDIKFSSSPKVVAISDNIPSEQIEYFKENGYRFMSNRYTIGNIPFAEELYAQTHALHSVKPTETEIKKLQLIKMAVAIFAEDDKYNVIPQNINTAPIRVFNSTDSNCTPVHAQIVNGKYQRLFIDRNMLKEQDFMTLVQESICQMLHTAGNDKSANYSYELTDLLRTQVRQFINDPTVAKRLRVLQKMYEGLGD